MADETFAASKLRQAQPMARNLALTEGLLRAPAIASGIRNNPALEPAPRPMPAPAPGPAAPPAPAPAPPAVPVAPGDNPFDSLPFPMAGDRIKADDFKRLSQSLRIIADMAVLSGSLFGRTFGEAKLALAGQGYQIVRVLSVFGAEIDSLADASLDARKVIQIMPAALGDRRVLAVVTEAVDTRRIMPRLVGTTYELAQQQIRALVGDAPLTGPQPSAPQLIGRTLGQSQQVLER